MAKRDLNDWFWRVGGDYSHVAVELGVRPLSVASNRFWQPRVDVLENEHMFVIKAELAGVHLTDIDLVYLPDEHVIVLNGVRREEDIPDMGRTGIHQLEVYYGEFERQIALPAKVRIVPERIHAQLKNGFLLVLVPKREPQA